MASAAQIRIVHAYLDTLACNARAASRSMAERSRLEQLGFRGNPEVQRAFDGRLDEWDRHRHELSDGIGAAADALDAVRAAFAAAEDQLVSALDDGG